MIRLFKQQKEAWDYLHDTTTKQIVYGGGAGGGKSLLGSLWLSTQIASKPGSTWAIGRSELKKIKLSTLITFKKMLKTVGFDEDSYKYDDQKSVMTFINGCIVVLVDLADNPGDTEFDRLGSTEYTGAFIDEAQEVSTKAKDILSSRLRNLYGKDFFYTKDKEEAERWIEENGRGILHYNETLKEYHVYEWVQEVPKLLMTCNPGRNFIYTDFYKPYKAGELLPSRAFIQSLPTSNPFLPKEYIESLKDLDKRSRERLLYGNFDYDDDPSLLFEIDDLNNMFRKPVLKQDTYYLTIDAARMGKDTTEIGVWCGLDLIKIIKISKGKLTEQAEAIQRLIDEYNVSLSNTIVDEVGVGGGLVDMLGCRGFIGNAAPMQPYSAKLLPYMKRNYANLKTQAFFYLQKYIQEGKITVQADGSMKEDLIEELLFIRQIDIDNDNKIRLESKKDLKDRLGRSPDIADMMSFRMFWIIKTHYNGEIIEEDKEEMSEKDKMLAFLMEEEEKEQEDIDLEVY